MSDREAVRVSYRYVDKLMAVYFGEDWFEDYESDEAASIADYVRRTATIDRVEALEELERIRGSAESPAAFERDFSYLSWAYRPGSGPTAYRDFADRLIAAIRSSLPDVDAPGP